MGKRPFVRFYHLDWKGDGDVEKMSMTEIGTYWTLLVRQMVDRSIESDFNELRRCLNVDTVEQVEALIVPRIRKKWHTSKCPYLTDKNYTDCEGWNCNVAGDDPTRLYNRRLVDVIVETDAARDRGTYNANKGHDMIRTPSLESSLVAKSEVEETPTFDFGELLRIMPKRRVKGSIEGWNQGKEMMKYITTQEEFDDLMAATRQYAKTRKGEDPAYHISLANWVTKEHRRFVPARAETPVIVPKTTDVLVNGSPRETAPEKRIPKNWCVPEGLKLARSLDKAPPWVVNDLDFAAKMEANRLFPTEASKHQWWTTPESTEQNVGA